MYSTLMPHASHTPSLPGRSTAAPLALAFAAFTLVLVTGASAQDTQPAQALPDIAPRVVEIRGNLEISLPSLQRQPLVGFNPPPRVAAIPPDRIPFVEEYKQESVDLPPSPLTPPQPPAVASLIGGDPLNGLIEGTAGRYLSRSVRFRSEWPVARNAAVYSKLDYAGSAGHLSEFALEEAKSAFDDLDALVGLQNAAAWATFGVELAGFTNEYRLYGAQPAAGYGQLRDAPPTRSGRGGSATLWMTTQATTGVDLDTRVQYGVASFETDALASEQSGNDDAAGSSDFLREETLLDVEMRLDAPLSGRQSFLGDLHFSGLGFDGESIGSSVTTFDGAGGVKLAAGKSLQVTGLARVMAFSHSDSVSSFYVSPDVRAELYPISAVRLYVRNTPRAEHQSSTSLYRESPFVVDRPDVQPTVYTIDGAAGTRLQVGVFEADVHVGYSRAPNFLYFQRASTVESHGYVRGMVLPTYAEAAVTYLGGDVAVSLPAGFHVTGGVTFRDGELTDLESDIPYFGPVVGRGALSYSFLDGKGFLQAMTTYESARYVNQSKSRKLGDYFDLDVHGSYEIMSGVGVVARMENLSAGYLERWEQYDQAPFVISLGLQARW